MNKINKIQIIKSYLREILYESVVGSDRTSEFFSESINQSDYFAFL